MNQDKNGHTTNWIEWWQYPHGISGAESIDIFTFTDNHERLHTHTKTVQELTLVPLVRIFLLKRTRDAWLSSSSVILHAHVPVIAERFCWYK